MNSDITGLARHLVNNGDMSEAQARSVMLEARNQLNSFIRQCIKDDLVDHNNLAAAISTVFGLPLLDLNCCQLAIEPTRVVSRSLLEKYSMLPLAFRNNRLVLALADPSQTQAISEIEFQSGKSADLVIVSYRQLAARLKKLNREDSHSALTARQQRLPEKPRKRYLQSYRPDEQQLPESDTPVIRAVNQILLDAVRLEASDIHIEPYEKTFRIRIRVDGVLQDFATPPIHLAGRLISRLKIMAQLDISERRLPQDGRIRLQSNGQRAVDFRVSTLPTLWGEKTVLRVMDPLRATLELEQLGFDTAQERLVKEAIARPQGMILVTGPTGSGKTVTLYSALSRINENTRNISTAEDPVELNIPGINQVQIRTATGLDFATVLRAFLRQDPDVIMVGEIRDRETVDIAVKAAQTGHLVLSTLHTNSAAETVTRLLNMGVAPYNVISSLSLVIAQRLARKLCEHCKQPAPETRDYLGAQGIIEALPEDPKFYRAAGCDRCHEGYRGRIGIYEVVPISEPMSRTIIRAGNSMDIAAQARKAGYSSLRQSVMGRLAEGLTSLEEADRITQENY